MIILTGEEIFKNIVDSIVNLEEDKAVELANEALKKKMNLLEVVEKGFAAGIRKVGELWEEGEFFLPELMRGAQIMQKCLDILIPHLQKGSEEISHGKVVIATIEGDIHSIGKTIVATMLRAYGYEVYDLGADVPAEKIVQEAVEKKADIIGVSALLTTTMTGQKKIIEILREKNLMNKFKVILGGAPVTSAWVEECNAHGSAENAIEAVRLVKSLLHK
ncbi:MAG: corrinoid protein [Candidatus Lokiarchaeota archaeon]|nr:corrinoid protein [Candidatus Lokiarchaeota archaeon]